MYKVSAPGSLMLFGEHAVLYHQHAIVAAIDKRITVTLFSLTDRVIDIISPLGNCTVDLQRFEVVAPFQFVLSACDYFKNSFKSGIRIKIESEFSDKVGFGSSAAVTVATVGALKMLLENLPGSKEDVFHIARKIILQVQGVGSGADVAASVYGGVSLYQMLPFKIENVSIKLPLSVIYSGYKTPTKEVVERVSANMQKNLEKYGPLLQGIDDIVKKVWPEVKKENWEMVGQYMNQQHTLMQALGVSTSKIDEIVAKLCEQAGIKGAKISGSGLGDCMIGLGKMEKKFPTNEIMDSQGVEEFLVNISPEGLLYDH